MPNQPLLFILNRILIGPLEAMFTLLIFILSYELHANPFQLALIASAKPVASFFAFYLNTIIFNKPQRIRGYLISINLLGCFPCLLFPFTQNIWFFIGSYALFMMTLRASFPAWSEILKQNVGVDKIATVLSKGTSVTYAITLFVPFLFSFCLDHHPQIWKTLFCILAIFQCFNTLVLSFINPQNTLSNTEKFSLRGGWNLLKADPHFSKYLLLFFIGGAGLVAMQPIIPIFFQETLQLSYTEITLAICLCKGTAFILSSPYWAKSFSRISIFELNGYINLFSCLFIAFILMSTLNIHGILLAYLMYGTMQAGCELTLNLSGPTFSKEKDSTFYSSLNLLLLGLRGAIFPFAGQLIFSCSNAETLFVVSGVICVLGLAYAFFLDKQVKLNNFRLGHI